MKVRQLTEKDISSFVTLWNQDYELLTTRKFIMTLDKALTGFRQKMFDYYGLFENDILVGFILYQLINKDMWIKHLLVHKDYRNKGMGKYLLLETLKKYKEKVIKADVLFENFSAKKFFEKNGFRVINKNIKEKGYILSYRKL